MKNPVTGAVIGVKLPCAWCKSNEFTSVNCYSTDTRLNLAHGNDRTVRATWGRLSGLSVP